jgi:hypothetical protein
MDVDVIVSIYFITILSKTNEKPNCINYPFGFKFGTCTG